MLRHQYRNTEKPCTQYPHTCTLLHQGARYILTEDVTLKPQYSNWTTALSFWQSEDQLLLSACLPVAYRRNSFKLDNRFRPVHNFQFYPTRIVEISLKWYLMYSFKQRCISKCNSKRCLSIHESVQDKTTKHVLPSGVRSQSASAQSDQRFDFVIDVLTYKYLKDL